MKLPIKFGNGWNLLIWAGAAMLGWLFLWIVTYQILRYMYG